ncbi:Copia protein [Glycine soja]
MEWQVAALAWTLLLLLSSSLFGWVQQKSAIAIEKNHGRTKHIKVNYDAIREAKKSKEISLEHCNSENQIADIMAKALSKGKFEEF